MVQSFKITPIGNASQLRFGGALEPGGDYAHGEWAEGGAGSHGLVEFQDAAGVGEFGGLPTGSVWDALVFDSPGAGSADPGLALPRAYGSD